MAASRNLVSYDSWAEDDPSMLTPRAGRALDNSAEEANPGTTKQYCASVPAPRRHEHGQTEHEADEHLAVDRGWMSRARLGPTILQPTVRGLPYASCMARENFDVEVPEGTHLGFSRDTDGAYRAHLFDNETNELVGHAELFEPERDDHFASDQINVFVYNDPSSREEAVEWSEILGNLAILGLILGAQKAAPHVQDWWNSKALPFLKSRRARRSRRSSGSDQIVATEVLMTEPEPSTAVDVLAALGEYRTKMGSDEARERLIAALVARIFSEEQLRIVGNAQIEDERDSRASAITTATPTSTQLEVSIRKMLEADPSWPDPETLAELERLLNGNLESRDALLLRVIGPGEARG